MRAILISAIGVALGLATPGVVAAQDWTGVYGGLTLGYASGNANHSFDNGAPSGNASPDGALVGGFLGYGMQSGTMVYGVEADIERNNASGSFTNLTGATSGGTTNGDYQASIRGVVGVAGQMAGKPARYYATAGWATGGFDFLGGPAAAATNPYSDTLSGWTAGVGMDVKVAARTSLRVEYRYTDFGEASGMLAPAFPTVTMPVKVDQHALRFGVRIDF